ncbi:MAG: GAF domain-containing protein [Gammaproteobacteria bacterium]|nr:GAF domain-containing protein [Gammaproteobacteria bacterium]
MSKNNSELTELKQLNLDLALRLERYEQQLRRMKLINEIAEAANSTSDPHQAVRHTLEQICQSANWPLAHAYFAKTSDNQTELISSRIWYITESGNFDEFIVVSEAARFKPGQGLPGIVLRDREALWANAIRSDAKRFALGRKIGIQSAFAFPVMMGDSVAAVLEFFSGLNLAPDEILLDIVAQLGMLLGRVFERAHAAEERAALNAQLIKASRRAGMAEIAAGVLHDVGNVLNSITVSSNLMSEYSEKTSIKRVSKLAGLLRDNQANLEEFLTTEKNGLNVINYTEQLGQQLREEQKMLNNELKSLLKNVAHVKNIIQRQQNYAVPSSIKEYVRLDDLIDDALKINNLQSHSYGISIYKNLAEIPPLYVDKHNLIQILNNLICNAKQALEGQTAKPYIKVISTLNQDDGTVSVSVVDNGCGITTENKSKIFQFGFTTKASGHGFGLHTSANTAQAMGGKLSFTSEGYGLGTTFTLVLPIKTDHSTEGEAAA